ncbi:zonadhesin-like, partial [Saccoglossus kowalevskii]|uniref:Uncharacterized protein LOC102805334 n=1 Tax=Saccoglossus kowalevskii TaxID=10224 RepID=A0ABM0LZX2_SACKO
MAHIRLCALALLIVLVTIYVLPESTEATEIEDERKNAGEEDQLVLSRQKRGKGGRKKNKDKSSSDDVDEDVESSDESEGSKEKRKGRKKDEKGSGSSSKESGSKERKNRDKDKKESGSKERKDRNKDEKESGSKERKDRDKDEKESGSKERKDRDKDEKESGSKERKDRDKDEKGSGSKERKDRKREKGERNKGTKGGKGCTGKRDALFGDTCYRYFHGRVDFEKANKRCSRRGSVMASVRSAEEAEFIKTSMSSFFEKLRKRKKFSKRFPPSQSVWVSAQNVDGGWSWANGDEWSYDDWDPNQPGADTCAALNETPDWKLATMECSTEAGVLCRKEPGDEKRMRAARGRSPIDPTKDCYCRAYGDVHYFTFDGRRHDFMGDCTYLLVEDLLNGQFKAESKNNYRSGKKPTVTLQDYVNVYAFGHVVKLDQGKIVYLDGVRQELPLNPETGFGIELTGNWVLVSTSYGFWLMWDGVSKVQIGVPKSYAGQLQGMCGDCDGDISNDGEHKNPNPWGNRWKVESSCADVVVDPPHCSDEDEMALEAKDKCGMIVDPDGPFGECATSDIVKDQREEAHHSCVFDMCHLGDEDQLCGALAEFMKVCRVYGFEPESFRNPDFCAYSCGSNSVYSHCTTTCPSNCVYGETYDCNEACDEGCVCDEGYTLSGTECVKQEECGCVDDDGKYHKAGVEWMKPDCSGTCTCGDEGEPECNDMSCNNDAFCGTKDGLFGCHCNDGYQGDGIQTCEQSEIPVPEVRAQGIPEDGVCNEQPAPVKSCGVKKVGVQVSCGEGRIVIKNVTYGRSAGDMGCDEGPVPSDECKAPNALSVVQRQCDGKHECPVTARKNFGKDGCSKKEMKFLTINYECNCQSDTNAEIQPAAAAPALDMPQIIECKSNEFQYEGTCYRFIKRQRQFQSAAKVCNRRGYMIASVRSEGEHEFLKTTIADLANKKKKKKRENSGSSSKERKRKGGKGKRKEGRKRKERKRNQKEITHWWVGGHKVDDEWEWINDDDWSYDGAWSTNEPGEQECTGLSKDDEWNMTTMDCNTETAVVCRRGPGDDEKLRKARGRSARDPTNECYCRAYGDPHYFTFDGQRHDFMGNCTYLLVEDMLHDPPYFRAQSKNDYREGKKPTVTLQLYVTVFVYGHVITLNQDKKILLDGNDINLPSSSVDGLNIELAGRWVLVSTALGFWLQWDGVSKVQIGVPKEYAGNLQGMCGDCDGDKNNDGERGNSNPWGNSWKVEQSCGDVLIQPEQCSADKVEAFEADDKCGMILDPNGPFGDCAVNSKVEEERETIHHSCLFDTCHLGDEDQLCAALTEFMKICRDYGFMPKTFRTTDFCPLTCQPYSRYNPCMSTCTPNCVYGKTPTCPDACDEGCECMEGYILSGNDCVPEEECGCVDDAGGYRKNGETWMTTDCSGECSCETGGEVECFDVTCHPDAYCGTKEGRFGCQCNDGYQGDGIESCEGSSLPVIEPAGMQVVATSPSVTDYPPDEAEAFPKQVAPIAVDEPAFESAQDCSVDKGIQTTCGTKGKRDMNIQLLCEKDQSIHIKSASYGRTAAFAATTPPLPDEDEEVKDLEPAVEVEVRLSVMTRCQRKTDVESNQKAYQFDWNAKKD